MSFLRLKRKINEDPKDILILASKKKKIENVQEDASIFELTGTASLKDNIDEVISEKFNTTRDVKERKFNMEKITNRLRAEHLQRSKHNRLHLFNCVRKIEENTPEKSVTIIDVSNDDESSSKTDEDYVYDIYYSKNDVDIKDQSSVADFSIHEVSSYIWKENVDSSEDENGLDDEDDSNDENNWRNDYPDEDYDVDSEDEDIDNVTNRLRRHRLNSDSLSSDDFDEEINAKLFKRKSNEDFDYFDEVASSEPESECYYE